MSKRMLFIYNPHSGKGLVKKNLADILDVFIKKGFEVVVYPTQAREDGMRKAQAEAGNYDRIVCSGGDGTLDEVMTGVVRSGVDVPIGYIPAGSTNDFANSLGIPKSMVRAAAVAAGDNTFLCDIGDFNGDTFVYVAAFGLFTEVSYKTSQQMKNVLGHVAYILEGAKYLSEIKSYSMQVHCNGQVIQDQFIYGMITNSKSVGGFKGITGNDVRLDDGAFEVTLIKTPKNPMELKEILESLTNRIDETDLIYTFKADEVKVVSKKVVPWTLDGEYGGDHQELLIRNLNQRVRIFVPKER